MQDWRPARADARKQLKTSIVIATHARPRQLERLIASLAPELGDSDRELIVAENGTTSPQQLEPRGFQIIHIHDPLPGKCRVQNRAIAAARGEIVGFLDDDLAVAPGYIAALESFFAGHPQFAAMKGRILAAEDPVRTTGAMAPYLDLPIVDHGDEVSEVRGVLGANMALRASVLEKVGGFDERLGPGACGHEEETEMSARLRRAGFRIGYAPRALVYHDVDAARADRARFIRVCRERGACRILHERHARARVAIDAAIAALRLVIARTIGASVARIAREEKRLAIAQGMLEGLRHNPGHRS